MSDVRAENAKKYTIEGANDAPKRLSQITNLGG